MPTEITPEGRQMSIRQNDSTPTPLSPATPSTEEQPGNWISLAALALSMLTAVWALTGYIMGPKVNMLPPTSVTFRYWPYGGANLALTGTTMNYVNEGRKDYDALVVSEYVLLGFPGRPAPLKLK